MKAHMIKPEENDIRIPEVMERMKREIQEEMDANGFDKTKPYEVNLTFEGYDIINNTITVTVELKQFS